MKYKVITGNLKAKTAFHIGTGAGNELTDALIHRDAAGKPFIPGTAIAGSLRSLLTRLAPRLDSSVCKTLHADKKERNKSCDCSVCRLFGDINPSDENGSTSNASCLLFFNAYQDENQTCQPMIRDGVGIDRVTGSAARSGSVKFDLEVIPAGASFKLRIELRYRDTDSTAEQLLAAGLSEWSKGRLRLGGRVARGLGSFILEDLQYKTIPLDNADNLMSFLKEDEPWKEIAKAQDDWLDSQVKRIEPIEFSTDMPESTSRGWFSLEGILQAQGPLLTNDNLSASISGFDHAPALNQLNDWLNPVLAGASLRGVLRSHAERLARTLATSRARNKGDFLHRCPACNPNVRSLENSAPLESCDSLLNKSDEETDENIKDSLCLACRLFGSTRLGSRLIIEDAHLNSDTKENPYKMLDFIAIDRFTGGGIVGAKFDALALWKPDFIFKLFLENPEPWELGWLWLVIRDLVEGWLSIGLGSAKGFGRVNLTEWKATFGFLHPADAPPGLNEIANEKKNGIYTTKTIKNGTNEKFEIIQKWVSCFDDQVNKFERLDSTKLTVDSYFDTIKNIYNNEGGAL